MLRSLRPPLLRASRGGRLRGCLTIQRSCCYAATANMRQTTAGGSKQEHREALTYTIYAGNKQEACVISPYPNYRVLAPMCSPGERVLTTRCSRKCCCIAHRLPALTRCWFSSMPVQLYKGQKLSVFCRTNHLNQLFVLCTQVKKENFSFTHCPANYGMFLIVLPQTDSNLTKGNHL